MPATAPARPRIALLLPLHSEVLGRAADAVLAGFMAAYERDRNDATVTVFATGESPQELLAGYADAVAGNDIVVGPLSRTDVTALAQSGNVRKPTIALTQPELSPEVDRALPRQMLVIGLSVEDEARQLANWAAAGKHTARALVISGGAAWQRRAASAFAAQWRQLGLEPQSADVSQAGAYLGASSVAQLKKRILADKPALLFVALDAAQARQVRTAVGRDMPMYGTSQLNPFVPQELTQHEPMPEMDGVRLLDLPWQIELSHPAVMIYPRTPPVPDQPRSPDLERLYALGIDAWRIASEIGAGHTRFEIDGVSGRLSVRFGEGTTRFQRTPLQAIYQDGVVTPLVPSR
ncbi:hypothetical protein GCM10022212_18450 [Actimicrobium antarcticum]|uniref:LppC family lipoprotein n=2 Tax=Actimicrobium antarcticum TaxID=1051899 RepID=A0ABP7T6F9_9BURK